MNIYHYMGAGLDNVYLKNGYREFTYGEDVAISIEDVTGLHRAIAASLIEKQELLNGKEIRFLRKELDLSQRTLGLLLAVTDQSIAKWEKDEHAIQGSANVVLRLLVAERFLNRKGEVSEFIKMLASIDRKETAELYFTETEEGWREAA
ncbi:MAG: putative transcriptional regulator [Lysobacterales bacterium]|jgi:putative transcriptional regulator